MEGKTFRLFRSVVADLKKCDIAASSLSRGKSSILGSGCLARGTMR